jgi:uncharacterized membrane protein
VKLFLVMLAALVAAVCFGLVERGWERKSQRAAK